MDSNKDEALRCINIAKQAIAAGNKQRALKFLTIARRLNHDLPVDDLLTACPSTDANNIPKQKDDESSVNSDRVSNGERNYTEEHVHLVRQIKTQKDYYSILGLEKSCSVEEIRKAYRKLSLKVHPDKNKAPGSEEAFKKVSKAFKCLSDDESRRHYDQTGLVEDFEYNQQHQVRRRRRRTGNDFFDDEFDPDEIFRAFFGQRDVFRNAHVYRTRTHNTHQREDLGGGGPNFMLLLQLLPFLIIILLAYLPFSEPEYSLQKNYSYQFKKMTEKHGVEFFVKSADFDRNYPIGSQGRSEIENSVIKDYKHMLGRYCHIEMQRRHWNRHFPTPHCDKLESFAA
ncbi:chaperone protein Dnaj 49 [Phtheirospermum japonicum]|uniref:Chaperone protein Dnaj 49 n=1 Tax=Phtheirospermum japonicum TaxID=374723 RepID=A0A830D2M5_9LAMI|nr:chaperone protein Dnaj 49 [Phtheirospermum japonicum]